MDGAAGECMAFDETVVFLSHVKDLPDPRQQGKVSYPLDEILLLCLLAGLAGAECRRASSRLMARPCAGPPTSKAARWRSTWFGLWPPASASSSARSRWR